VEGGLSPWKGNSITVPDREEAHSALAGRIVQRRPRQRSTRRKRDLVPSSPNKEKEKSRLQSPLPKCQSSRKKARKNSRHEERGEVVCPYSPFEENSAYTANPARKKEKEKNHGCPSARALSEKKKVC